MRGAREERASTSFSAASALMLMVCERVYVNLGCELGVCLTHGLSTVGIPHNRGAGNVRVQYVRCNVYVY